MDVAGDAATAALTAVSAAADEAQARLSAKARMRELEHAVVTARAGGRVDVAPPTREEALKLADRVEPGSSPATLVRGLGLALAAVAAIVMAIVGGFGWLGAVVPLALVIGSAGLGSWIEIEDRSRKAARIQLQVARASLPALAAPATENVPAARGTPAATALAAPSPAAAPVVAPGCGRSLTLVANRDPRTRTEVLTGLDRIIAGVQGLVNEDDMATLGRIRASALVALPATDVPLDLADHETWLLRQICIDFLPGALEHYIALPIDLASEPVLDGRSARQVLDEQLQLIESRLEQMATRRYRREAGGLLTHARFVTDVLRPDPFQARLEELAAQGPDRPPVDTPDTNRDPSSSATMAEAPVRTREGA